MSPVYGGRRPPFVPAASAAAFAFLFLGGGTAAFGQYSIGYSGPYVYSPFVGQPFVSPGPSMASGWAKLGDGIVGNEPRAPKDRGAVTTKFDVRFVPHGWVVVWDTLVPLTDLSRNGSLYVLHPAGDDGRVRITLGDRELFENVLFAKSYEEARTLLEGT